MRKKILFEFKVKFYYRLIKHKTLETTDEVFDYWYVYAKNPQEAVNMFLDLETLNTGRYIQYTKIISEQVKRPSNFFELIIENPKKQRKKKKKGNNKGGD